MRLGIPIVGRELCPITGVSQSPACPK